MLQFHANCLRSFANIISPAKYLDCKNILQISKVFDCNPGKIFQVQLYLSPPASTLLCQLAPWLTSRTLLLATSTSRRKVCSGRKCLSKTFWAGKKNQSGEKKLLLEIFLSEIFFSKPLTFVNEKSQKKEAVAVFKLVQIYMSDRKAKVN